MKTSAVLICSNISFKVEVIKEASYLRGLKGKFWNIDISEIEELEEFSQGKFYRPNS